MIQQKYSLMQRYEDLIEDINLSKDLRSLSLIIRLQPSPESIVYRIHIWLKEKEYPKARIVDPSEIAKYNGEKPHHLYDRKKDGQERLCVFYPGWHEWNSRMHLSDTFVPWIITWLRAYEFWQITGEWVYPDYVDGNKN